MRKNPQVRKEIQALNESLMQNHCIATDYLANRPQLQGKGVVVIFKGKAAGWMNTLRDPQGWEPGCIAVDADGHQWQATGGDAYAGAQAWHPLPCEPTGAPGTCLHPFVKRDAQLARVQMANSLLERFPMAGSTYRQESGKELQHA